MSACKPSRKKRPARHLSPSAAFDTPSLPGAWQMGGSGSQELAAAYGVSEAEVALLAVSAIPYALEMSDTPERFVCALGTGFVMALADRLGVDLRREEEFSAA